MIESVLSLLMNYFPDNRPVSITTLNRKCQARIVEQALCEGYIQELGTDSTGCIRYVITDLGRDCRDHSK